MLEVGQATTGKGRTGLQYSGRIVQILDKLGNQPGCWDPTNGRLVENSDQVNGTYGSTLGTFPGKVAKYNASEF